MTLELTERQRDVILRMLKIDMRNLRCVATNTIAERQELDRDFDELYDICKELASEPNT